MGLKVFLGPSRIQPSLGREHSKAGFITTSLHDPKDLTPTPKLQIAWLWGVGVDSSPLAQACKVIHSNHQSGETDVSCSGGNPIEGRIPFRRPNPSRSFPPGSSHFNKEPEAVHCQHWRNIPKYIMTRRACITHCQALSRSSLSPTAPTGLNEAARYLFRLFCIEGPDRGGFLP